MQVNKLEIIEQHKQNLTLNQAYNFYFHNSLI